MCTERIPKIGEIYMMEFDGTDHCQAGKRPGIILQNNVGNANSPNIIAVPLTSCLKKRNMPSHVVIPAAETDLARDSLALCENPTCLSKTAIGFYITTLPEKYMKDVAKAIMIAIGAISFLDEDELSGVWRTTKKLNDMVHSN